MESLERFKIKVPETVLEELKARIKMTRWPDEADNAQWNYGTNLQYLKDLAQYWLEDFNWAKQEQILNSFNQYKVQIDECSIHFVYERSKLSNAIPIIISHGWPSSFTEMLKIIPMLTDPLSHGGKNDEAFDVIVPSLPGFAFSSARNHGHMRAHELWIKLMRDVLGYKRFMAQGTDIGVGVTSQLGRFYPEWVMGIHISSVDLLWPNPLPEQSKLSEAEINYISNFSKWDDEENGYGHMQGTRPQTLAYGLNDSPIGLAAWVIEKYYKWSDCNDIIESRFSKDELLTNIMIYWVTQCINSSIRHYYYSKNMVNSPAKLKPGERIKVPTGVAMFPGEKDLIVPREFAERCYNIRHWTDMPSGGHFAALEEPELLVKDIRKFAKSLRRSNKSIK
jgi:pimeloyl-ACP methyl ester carboxylesterase